MLNYGNPVQPIKTDNALLVEICDLLRDMGHRMDWQNDKLDTIIGRMPPYQYRYYPYQRPYYGPYWSGTTSTGGTGASVSTGVAINTSTSPFDALTSATN